MATQLDGVHLAPSSLRALNQLGDAYKDGDAKLRKRIRDALKKSADELARDVPRIGSAKMPARGGLRARFAGAKGAVSVALTSKNVSVSIRTKTREGYALRPIDRDGIIAHPVWGRGDVTRKEWAWARQRIAPHAFTEVFEDRKPEVQKALRDAVHMALQDIARDAT